MAKGGVPSKVLDRQSLERLIRNTVWSRLFPGTSASASKKL